MILVLLPTQLFFGHSIGDRITLDPRNMGGAARDLPTALRLAFERVGNWTLCLVEDDSETGVFEESNWSDRELVLTDTYETEVYPLLGWGLLVQSPPLSLECDPALACAIIQLGAAWRCRGDDEEEGDRLARAASLALPCIDRGEDIEVFHRYLEVYSTEPPRDVPRDPGVIRKYLAACGLSVSV